MIKFTSSLSLLPLVAALFIPFNDAIAISQTTKLPAIHICSKSDPSYKILACNLYKEARGEGTKGMMAVGFVTLNRLDDPAFPDSVRKVVYQPSQFSWTNSKKVASYKIHNRDSWKEAVSISKSLIYLHNLNKFAYDFLDFSRGSVYYHSTEVNPYWSKSFDRVGKIGNHIFYSRKEG